MQLIAVNEPGLLNPTSLGSTVLRIAYDVDVRTGRIYLPPHACTDMTGAIALMTALDPDVRQAGQLAQYPRRVDRRGEEE